MTQPFDDLMVQFYTEKYKGSDDVILLSIIFLLKILKAQNKYAKGALR